MPTKPDVRLEIAGTLYGGWTSISVRRGLDQVAGTFDLAVTERWPGSDIPRPIRPGEACRLLVDGAAVVTGHVDDVQPSYDATSHTVSVSGRDKTGDLVDCSAPSVQWMGRSLPQVAADLCRPFGIAVRAECPCAAPFQRLKNNEGDSVFDTLAAAARVRAVLLVTDGSGDLILTRAGTGPRVSTVLELGENILSASAAFSMRDRYSAYTVKGQGVGSDEWDAEAAAHPSGSASDPRVPRHRPLTILAEEQTDAASARERALWEAASRYGRGRSVTVTVLGWSHASGLWAPGQSVRVRDSWIGLDESLLVSRTAYTLDGKGWRCELTLMPAEAWKLLAVPEPDDGGW